MKKICAVLSLAICAVSAFAAYEFTQDIGSVPKIASNYIKKHFPTATISGIKIEKKLLKVEEYEVMLSDGTEMEFTPTGELKSLKNRVSGLPTQVVEKNVSTYLEQNHFGKKLIGVEKKSDGIEVKIENGLVIKFDESGKFVGNAKD